MSLAIFVTFKAIDHDIYNECRAFAAAYYYERYGIQLTEFPETFTFAQHQDVIIGVCGITGKDTHDKLTTEWYVSASAIQELATGNDELCELGTLVVSKQRTPQVYSGQEIVCALTIASILVAAKHLHRSAMILTGNRSMLAYSRILGISLKKFGVPDLSKRDSGYRQKWSSYFEKTPRQCFGFDLPAAADCCGPMMQKLVERNISIAPGNMIQPNTYMLPKTTTTPEVFV